MITKNTIKILIVEDDAFDARILKDSLKKSELNISITQISCLTKAENLNWSDPANNYHCIILDYTFPVGVSTNFLHLQKNVFKNKSPIIVLTGLDSKILKKNIEMYNNVYFMNKSDETYKNMANFIAEKIDQ